MLGGRSWESWIAEYSESHQHPLNRLTHTFGIPIIMLSLPLLVAGIVWRAALWIGVGSRWWFAKMRGKVQVEGAVLFAHHAIESVAR
jgi:Protein of unknown function (DUF962)